MRQKVSIGLAILGLAIIVYALTLNGQNRLATVTLGVIVACGGGVMILASGRWFQGHRAISWLMRNSPGTSRQTVLGSVSSSIGWKVYSP